jgi:hypothetical protein
MGKKSNHKHCELRRNCTVTGLKIQKQYGLPLYYFRLPFLKFGLPFCRWQGTILSLICVICSQCFTNLLNTPFFLAEVEQFGAPDIDMGNDYDDDDDAVGDVDNQV